MALMTLTHPLMPRGPLLQQSPVQDESVQLLSLESTSNPREIHTDLKAQAIPNLANSSCSNAPGQLAKLKPLFLGRRPI